MHHIGHGLPAHPQAAADIEDGDGQRFGHTARQAQLMAAGQEGAVQDAFQEQQHQHNSPAQRARAWVVGHAPQPMGALEVFDFVVDENHIAPQLKQHIRSVMDPCPEIGARRIARCRHLRDQPFQSQRPDPVAVGLEMIDELLVA